MMKPIVTWVLVANTRKASVLENRGPGKGLGELSGQDLQSDTADLPRDRAGAGHSIGGHGSAAVDQSDPQKKVDAQFASAVAGQLSRALSDHKFDRLIVAAGPHMLGLLRDAFDAGLKSALVGEIDKDLSNQPAEAIASHIDGIIAT